VSGIGPCAQSRSLFAKATERLQLAAEVVVLSRPNPRATGRTEL
jgi:hypothetical protein